MKNLILSFAFLCLLGCSQRSPYDVSAAQLQRHISLGGPMHGSIDLNHLPPGAVKDVKVYHKGDILPDGTVSPGERKMVRITMSPRSGSSQGTATDDVIIREKAGP